MATLLELLASKKASMNAGRKAKTAKVPAGRSRWKILGSWKAESEQFWHDFGQHFVKNLAGETVAVYVCTDKTYGRPCSVCDQVGSAIRATTDDAMLKVLKDAKGGGRVLVNAVQLDGPTPNLIQILELPPTAFGMIADAVFEWEQAGEKPLDPKVGKDFIISKEGTGLNTKYSVQVAAKSTPFTGELKLNDLDDYVKQESTEALNRALNSVRNVAGLLAAPGASSPGTSVAALGSSMPASTTIDDDYEVATPPARPAPVSPVKPAAVKVVEPNPFEDVPDDEELALMAAEVELAAKKAAAAAKKAAAATKAATPAPVAAAAPAVAAEGTGDPELDDLLAKLG